MKKTEEAILKIREELDNITIPDVDILQKINPEMAAVFESIKSLRTTINSLEYAFGPLDQYGIADEIENLEV